MKAVVASGAMSAAGAAVVVLGLATVIACGGGAGSNSSGGASSSGASSTSSGNGSSSRRPVAADEGLVPAGSVWRARSEWFRPIDTAPVAAISSEMVGAIKTWGKTDIFEVDLSFNVLESTWRSSRSPSAAPASSSHEAVQIGTVCRQHDHAVTPYRGKRPIHADFARHPPRGTRVALAPRMRTSSVSPSLFLAGVLAVASLAGCGGMIAPVEPGQAGTAATSAPPGSGSAPAATREPKGTGPATTWSAQAACEGVRTAIDGPNGTGPRSIQTLRASWELEDALQGFWFACEGQTGFDDVTATGKLVLGILIEGDEVTSILPRGDGGFVRGASIGRLDAIDGLSFRVGDRTHWAVFSKDGASALSGRSDLGSTEVALARLAWDD
jgi:hypothetical protein